jgi:hypothetical protein
MNFLWMVMSYSKMQCGNKSWRNDEIFNSPKGSVKWCFSENRSLASGTGWNGFLREWTQYITCQLSNKSYQSQRIEFILVKYHFKLVPLAKLICHQVLCFSSSRPNHCHRKDLSLTPVYPSALQSICTNPTKFDKSHNNSDAITTVKAYQQCCYPASQERSDQ